VTGYLFKRCCELNKGANMKFGFLIDKKSVQCDSLSIEPLPEFEDIKNCFYDKTKVSDGWVYGAEGELKKNSRELKNFKQRGPITCNISPFRMGSTHQIQMANSDEEHLRFLIMGYGFLQGLFLLPEKYSYLWRIPYEPGKLNGLILCGNDRENGMEQINYFYQNANSKERKQAFAIMHWFLIGQSYTSQWDKFEAQYKVLDGVFALSKFPKNPKIPHTQRPIKLATKYGIILPQWAELNFNSRKSSKLSILRNELIHEAKYNGEPIGYAHPPENYTLEFKAFNTKLICGVLGIDTPYLQTNPNTRDQFSWNIKI